MITPRLVVRVRKSNVALAKIHPEQALIKSMSGPRLVLDMFKAASVARRRTRPPGSGWHIAPKGKKGGFRRKRGKGWEYWYPDKGIMDSPLPREEKVKLSDKVKRGIIEALKFMGVGDHVITDKSGKLTKFGKKHSKYLGEMTKYGLIERHTEDGKRVYRATEKGRKLAAPKIPKDRKPQKGPALQLVRDDEKITDAMAHKKTKGQRKDANQRALEIVQKAIKESRGLTDEESVIVAEYTGKGGISGDLNQFYTRVDVAQAMWDISKLHAEGDLKRVLEPSCGSGVFIQTAPSETRMTGVELDPMAAGVADALHGHKHTIEGKAFEEFTIENLGTPLNYDGVIANPPYCTRTGDIPRHKPEIKSADHYFIDTSLDHTKDGGICTFLIHPGVLNNKTPTAVEFRKQLLARAEIVDAFRLPDDTFKHVHCGISADILVVKKRDNRVGHALINTLQKDALEPTLKALKGWDQNFVEGTFFERHPERILGQALTKEETGWRPTVVGDIDKVPDELRRLSKEEGIWTEPCAKPISYDDLSKFGEQNTLVRESLDKAESDITFKETPPELGDVMKIADRQFLYIGDPPKWTPMDTIDDVSQIINQSNDDAIKEAYDISRDIRTLMDFREKGDYYKARNLRRRVAERVKKWVDLNGIPGSHKMLGELSRSAPHVLDFIACVNSDGQLSDVLGKDAAVTLSSADVDKTDFLSVANYIAARNGGYVTESDIQHNWEGWESQSDGDIRKMLLNTGEYVVDASARTNELQKPPLQHIEDYLTGDLYEKLDVETERLRTLEGEEREQVQRQIDAIKKRLDSTRKSIDDVHIQLRAMNWMPLSYFDEFLNSDTGRQFVFGKPPQQDDDLRAHIDYTDGIYTLQWLAPDAGFRNWEGDEYQPGDVVSETIGDYDWLKYMNRMGLKKEQVEEVEERVENTLNEWIKSSDLREPLEERYNRVFTSEFQKIYSGEPLGLEGLSEGIVPHDYQNQAVRWAAETGKGILGQDVGLGKTFIAILLARLRKQQGKAQKPFVVVPKSVATNWAEETEALFPGSKVLVIGEHKKQVKSGKVYKKAVSEAKSLGLTGQAFDDYVSENTWVTRSDTDIERNRKLAMVKQNDYDLIICSKPAFERIPLKKQTVEKLEKEEFWYQRGNQINQARENSKSIEAQEKKIEKIKSAFSEETLRQKFQHKEDFVYWEDMEIDTLIADEAHAYKNLYPARSRQGKAPKFIGGSAQSKQARKMYMMSEYVRSQRQSNGVYFLTATPTKNSPLEVYNMLQHIAPEAFRKIGIDNSETFIDRFCQMETKQVLDPSGELVDALCVTGFKNLKELESVMDKYMMIQTAQDVGLKIPDANHKLNLVDMTEEQERVYDTLREEAIEAKNDRDNPGEMFRVLDKMKKAAQDLEILDPETYSGWFKKSPKYNACVEEAYKGAKERGGQIIFCDHNASHERLKEMLMDKGLKEHEIGIINADVAADSAQRQEIGNKFNRGVIKVVIGNTGTMGEGVNLQGKKHEHGTTDIHHLDQPWDPGTMLQRNGRGVRQGNRSKQVNIHAYLSKGSFDGFRYGTLKGKERWLDKLRAGSDSIANDMEGQGLGEAEALAMMSKDPEAAMAELEEKKKAAKGKWFAKQTKAVVADFMRYQGKVERYERLKEGAASKKNLGISIEKERRRLLRNELLPDPLRGKLQSDDRRKTAVITKFEGEGDEMTVQTKVFHKGDVLTDFNGNRLIVEDINLHEQTIKGRGWMQNYVRTGAFSDVAKLDYELSDYKATDELKEQLQKIPDHRYPVRMINHIDHETLRAHRDVIDDAVINWYHKNSAESDVLVKTKKGELRVIPFMSMTPETKMYYPWEFKEKELVDAIVAHNKTDLFDTYHNDLIDVIRKQYDMSHTSYWMHDKNTAFMKRVVDKARKIYEKQNKKAA